LNQAVLTPAVSQFTLLASVKKGNKPDFHQSASGDKARSLYQTFYNKVSELYEPQKVKDGVFAAMMDVALVNDGPVCLRSCSAATPLRKLYPDF
jgi:D-tyrosyl-tRNA(Tyr) deacylase